MRPPWPPDQTSGVPATGSAQSRPSSTTRRRPAFSVTSRRPSGRKAIDHGISRPSTTVSTRKACFSLVTTVSPAGWANVVCSRSCAMRCSRMKITRARISSSERASPNAGIPASSRPPRMLAARLASSPPKLHSSSRRVGACPPSSFAPWQLAQVSDQTRPTSAEPAPGAGVPRASPRANDAARRTIAGRTALEIRLETIRSPPPRPEANASGTGTAVLLSMSGLRSPFGRPGFAAIVSHPCPAYGASGDAAPPAPSGEATERGRPPSPRPGPPGTTSRWRTRAPPGARPPGSCSVRERSGPWGAGPGSSPARWRPAPGARESLGPTTWPCRVISRVSRGGPHSSLGCRLRKTPTTGSWPRTTGSPSRGTPRTSPTRRGSLSTTSAATGSGTHEHQASELEARVAGNLERPLRDPHALRAVVLHHRLDRVAAGGQAQPPPDHDVLRPRGLGLRPAGPRGESGAIRRATSSPSSFRTRPRSRSSARHTPTASSGVEGQRGERDLDQDHVSLSAPAVARGSAAVRWRTSRGGVRDSRAAISGSSEGRTTGTPGGRAK